MAAGENSGSTRVSSLLVFSHQEGCGYDAGTPTLSFPVSIRRRTQLADSSLQMNLPRWLL